MWLLIMIRFIDLFAGIGGIRIPFDELGYQCVFSSEWDKAACDTYAANFGERPAGDITKIPAEDIPSHDLLLAGFPCQAFSYAGKSMGFEDTRGTLFFEFARCVKETMPKIAVGENVKGLLKHDNGRTLQTMINTLTELGYNVRYKVWG